MSVAEVVTADVRQQLLAAMRDAADDVIALACEQLLKLPVYRHLAAGDEGDVREFSAWLFHVFLACLDEDRGLSPAETARLAAVGRSRSERGIDVAGFTTAFEIVYDRCHARLLDLATGMPDSAASAVLAELSRALGSLSRAAVLAVASGFEDVDEAPGGARTRAANALLQALVSGVGNHALLAETAGVLGLAADDALHIVIAVPSIDQSALTARLDLGEDDGLELLASTVRQRPVMHAVGLVAARGGETLEMAVDPRDVGHILITQQLQGIGDLGTQYTDVRPYLHLAKHLTDGGAVSLDDLRMFVGLGAAGLRIVEPLVRSRLGDVLAQEPDEAEWMLATIGAYLESGTGNKLTGERLNLHPKSIAARIRKIRRNTTVALDPGVDGALTLLAVQFYRVHRSDLPEMGDQWWTR